MNKAILGLAATAAALVSLSGSASAAPFQPLQQRLVQLDQRIDQGVRSGALTRSDADSLRVGIARIRLYEAQYRRGGINAFEQNDLNRRFDNLARHVTVAPSDRYGNGDRFQQGRSYQGNSNYRGNSTNRGNSSTSDRGSYADRGGNYDRGYRR
jgi:hypothetical protein